MSDPRLNNANAATSLAAMAVEEVLESGLNAAGRVAARTATIAGRAGGIAVQPAVWVATGATPDALDMALYAVGSAATAVGAAVVGVAAGAVGVAREVFEGEIDRKLAVARLTEPKPHRRFIDATSRYSGGSGPETNAARIAQRGGTAWQHRNGLWVYIVDATGRLVCDYEPADCLLIKYPRIPLQRQGTGFRWADGSRRR